MTAQEVGAYALLMCVTWKENGIANDMDELATVSRMGDAFAESWEKHIKRCFILREDGRWDHPRLQAERVKQQDFSAKMHDAAMRRHKKAEPRQKVGKANLQVGNALQSSSSSSNISSSPSVRRGKPAPWMGGVIATWKKHYPDTVPPKGTANALRSAFEAHPEEQVLEDFDAMLGSTPGNFLNLAKWAATYRPGGDSVVPINRPNNGKRGLPPVTSAMIDWPIP
jgi:uncharacterized protein YdaU (DUF1376 family)